MDYSHNIISFMAIMANSNDQGYKASRVVEFRKSGFDFTQNIPIGYSCSDQTLLHWAVCQNDGHLIELLVQNGLDINIVDKFHATCLFDAIHNISMTLLLLKLGIDMTIEAKYFDFSGTVLQWAKDWYDKIEYRRENCQVCKSKGGEFCSICKNYNLEHLLVIESLEYYEVKLPDAKPASRRK